MGLSEPTVKAFGKHRFHLLLWEWGENLHTIPKSHKDLNGESDPILYRSSERLSTLPGITQLPSAESGPLALPARSSGGGITWEPVSTAAAAAAPDLSQHLHVDKDPG